MSVIDVQAFFNYINTLNRTFPDPEHRLAKYNGSYKLLLENYFIENLFDSDPLVFKLLLKYREREISKYGRKRNAG